MFDKEKVPGVVLGIMLAVFLIIGYVISMPNTKSIKKDVEQAFLNEIRYDIVNDKDNNLSASYDSNKDQLSIEYYSHEKINSNLEEIKNQYYTKQTSTVKWCITLLLIFAPLLYVLLATDDSKMGAILLIVIVAGFIVAVYPNYNVDFVEDEINSYKYNELLDKVDYKSSVNLSIPKELIKDIMDIEPEYIHLKVHEKSDSVFEKYYQLDEFVDSLGIYVYKPIP